MKCLFARFFALIATLSVCSCGQDSNSNLPTVSLKAKESANAEKESALDNTPGRPLFIAPSDLHYENQLVQKMLFSKQNLAQNGATIWLNFNGGPVDNAYLISAGLECENGSNLSASKITMDEIQMTVDEINNSLDFDQMNIMISEPRGGVYSTIHIGGSPQELGCNNLVASTVAVNDPGNLIAADVAHVFDDDLAKMKKELFQVIDAIVGKEDFAFSQSDKISVDQIQRYTNMSLALKELKPEDIVDISRLSSDIDRIVPPELLPLAGIEKLVTIVAIAGSGQDGFDVNRAKDVLGNLVNSPGVSILGQIASAAGVPGVGIAIDLAKLIFGNKGEQTENKLTELPDFSELLEVNQGINEGADIIRQFDTHSLYIDQTYPDVPEMKTLVILAFLQAAAK